MRPARLLVVPGPAAIIVAPVIANRKTEDRQAEHRAIVHQRDVATLVWRTEQRRKHPAAQIRRRDIAPLVVGDTAHHRHRYSGRQLRDDRVIGSRARAHVDAARRESLRLRVGHDGQRQQAGCYIKTSNQMLFHSFSRFKGRLRLAGQRVYL
jgi:hypothetical protein